MKSKRIRLLKKVKKEKYRYTPLKCKYCGLELERNNWYHKSYGTCYPKCYMYMVRMSYSEFY